MTEARHTEAVLRYFREVGSIRATGGATPELSYHTPLTNLLNAIGDTLDPKVHCVGELRDAGADRPDMGLYSARQIQQGERREGQLPERGVVEVKPPTEDVRDTAAGEQVRRYRGLYGLVLVTNLRDFLLQEAGENGERQTLESFTLADSEEEFDIVIRRRDVDTRKVRAGLGEFLFRALSHHAALAEPRFLAVQLASYARDALARVEAAATSPRLGTLRAEIEKALRSQFRDEDGDRLFRSTLVQTLFYGVFSAWVLWARKRLEMREVDRFRWQETDWNLTVPVLAALFRQMASPTHLRPLGLVEVLDWTAATLDRVDKEAFFRRFREGEAVPYFYEPFLEAFDPDLRKKYGVWYTPPEVVRYMVARVDRALKDDLGIPLGLAAENVYVLDPCCGTGAYLAEVLRLIDANLTASGEGALSGEALREAAAERVIGFEIMPAPYVVAHMQVGLALTELDANGTSPAIYFTNALTGWEGEPSEKQEQLWGVPELQEERERADEVKRDKPVLVVLGNPPYNGFAGMAVDEERELSGAYRETRHAPRPRGHGLNDLYVRFFRMAERRIAEQTGEGVVCFISNYSWLDGLSHTGMRERYLDAFDAIRIDCLNGDIRKGALTPSGEHDPSVFTTDSTIGIKVGTAIATLVRKADHAPARAVAFRHLWGESKRAELTETADTPPDALYETLAPPLPLGLPFTPATVSAGYFDWPALPDLFPQSFPGVKTSRDPFLVDIDRERLEARIADYFDADVRDEEIERRYPSAMKGTTTFDERRGRQTLLTRGGPQDKGFIPYAYRPFDNRWLYWEEDSGLVDRPRPEYLPHVFEGNRWIEAREREAMDFSRGAVVRHLADNWGNGLSSYFPAYLLGSVERNGEPAAVRRPNLSPEAERYLGALGLAVEDLFHHALAVLHDPAYREANAGALRMGWPRIPCPGWPDGGSDVAGARAALLESAARGRELATLLDVDADAAGAIRPELATIAVPHTADGTNMAGDDFALTAGWGHFGAGEAVMPGQGRVVERPFTDDEREALGGAADALGGRACDVYLNGRAYWRNVPAAVWEYRLGGYQVLKKWLSYRERKVLGRPLRADEVTHFRDTARRIAAILLLTAR